jgi:hypothetical protein
MNHNNLDEIRQFLKEPQVVDILTKVQKEKNALHLAHFNIFSLVSDHYRKENLHSDILAEFLNPQGRHGQGNVFLLEFIRLINAKAQEQKRDVLLDVKAFTSASVIREEGRIDILICGDKEAIIFENKINNAGDTARQLPDYFQLIKGKGYSNIMIVYMPYRAGTLPEEKGWQQGDAKMIYPSLVLFNAFEQGKRDLREGLIARWLEIATVKNASILFQYAELLKMLGGYTMNHQDITAFISDQGNWSKLGQVAHLIEKLPEVLIQEVFEEVKSDLLELLNNPDMGRGRIELIYDGKSSFFVKGFRIGQEKFRIVFQCQAQGNMEFRYLIRFWDENYRNNKLSKVEALFTELEFSPLPELAPNNESVKTFIAPFEKELFIQYSKDWIKCLCSFSSQQEKI